MWSAKDGNMVPSDVKCSTKGIKLSESGRLFAQSGQSDIRNGLPMR